MEIRIQRSVSVLPEYNRQFITVALQGAAHAKKVMGVEPEIFYNAEGSDGNADFRIFTDFQSMEQYEKSFLEKLLLDSTYLRLSEKMVKMISDEPLDELFVRLRPNDYFMNLGVKKVKKYDFESAPARKSQPRYRREREYCAAKGRLREVMQLNFGFMDSFYRGTGNPPSYFCTRFSVERIGCSKMFFDFDDNCPICGPAFLEQDELFSSKFNGMLLTKPIDSLFMRVNGQDANFQLAGLKSQI